MGKSTYLHVTRRCGIFNLKKCEVKNSKWIKVLRWHLTIYKVKISTHKNGEWHFSFFLWKYILKIKKNESKSTWKDAFLYVVSKRNSFFLKKLIEIFCCNMPALSLVDLILSLSLCHFVYLPLLFSAHVPLPYDSLPFSIKKKVLCVVTCSVVFFFLIFMVSW